jgi:hypothetical protein
MEIVGTLDQNINDSEENFFEDPNFSNNVTETENKLFDIIFEAEKKFGPKVHFAIEIVFKDDDNDDDICYWVEFENQNMYFETIEEVEDFLLNKAIVTGEGPEVIYENELTEDETQSS